MFNKILIPLETEIASAKFFAEYLGKTVKIWEKFSMISCFAGKIQRNLSRFNRTG